MFLSDSFICAGEKYSTYSRHIPAPLFKKRVDVLKKIKRAEITVCGLGFYELYLNGENITKGRLCPYISNSDQVVFYDNYDISNLLTEGTNNFEFLLGNGMQNAFGGFIWDFDKAAYRSSPKFAFAVEITYEDGEYLIIEADESVVVGESKIISDDLRLGEIYDAGKLQGKIKNAVKTSSPKGVKRLSRVSPIITRDEIKPVRIFKEKNDFIYDFGINTSGLCRLKVNGKKDKKSL